MFCSRGSSSFFVGSFGALLLSPILALLKFRAFSAMWLRVRLLTFQELLQSCKDRFSPGIEKATLHQLLQRHSGNLFGICSFPALLFWFLLLWISPASAATTIPQVLESLVFSSICKSNLVVRLGFAAFCFFMFGKVIFGCWLPKSFNNRALAAGPTSRPSWRRVRTDFTSKAAAAQLSSPLSR